MAGYALILVDSRRQGLQDKLAGTLVRYVPQPEARTYVRSRTARIRSPHARLTPPG
jgi:hypothetical protein